MVLFTGADWDFNLLSRMLETCEGYGKELGYDIYPNRVEIVSSEQMLDAYASIGMPVFYKHWSFGKRQIIDTQQYQKGKQSLAYELVINSSPCVSYCMEDNTALMQLLVIAHACVAGETEYLSPTGWRHIANYDNGLVGQYTKEGTVHFVQPTDYIVRPQKTFLHFKSDSIDQIVTDDHDLVFQHHKENHTFKAKAGYVQETNKKLSSWPKFRVVSKFKFDSHTTMCLSNKEIMLKLFIKLFGKITHSDNYGHSVEIIFTKDDPNLSKFNKVYDLSFDHETKKTVVFDFRSTTNTVFDHEWYRASQKQLKFIYKNLIDLTGNKFDAKHIDYVQFVASAIGYNTKIVKKNKKYKIVTFTKNDKLGNFKIKEVESKDGNAYCFTVPSGMFVIRHNGKIAVTGNCIGHNHFFKNNYMFKEWTDPHGWLDYLEYAKNFVAKCEEKEGKQVVERTLDAAHALMNVGVFKFPKKRPRSLVEEEALTKKRHDEYLANFNLLWASTLNQKNSLTAQKKLDRSSLIRLPEENILYFLEKYAPKLETWQREILRIVYTIAQYFYPQSQTKVGNEAMATYTHYNILTKLWQNGLISDGHHLEFLHSHTGVVAQQTYDSPYYNGINPYYLGFEILTDIERICHNPTKEDKEWFPTFAGCKDHWPVIFDVCANYRDESMILQFLSPHLIRKMRLFSIHDKSEELHQTVTHIQNEQSYRELRSLFAKQYERDNYYPNIEVASVNWDDDRTLYLHHHIKNKRKLDPRSTEATLQHIRYLWGYKVEMIEYHR